MHSITSDYVFFFIIVYQAIRARIKHPGLILLTSSLITTLESMRINLFFYARILFIVYLYELI